MRQDRRTSRRLVIAVSASFLLFVVWESLAHAWGLQIPHFHTIAATVEMLFAVTITTLALQLARPQSAPHRDSLLGDLNSMLAADLRPQLVSLLAALRALETQHRESLSEEELALVRHAAVDSSAVLDLVDELGPVGPASPGSAALAHTPVMSIIEEVIGTVRARAREKGVELDVDLSAGLSAPEANSGQLVALLIELLSAAIERTPSGGAVKLTARHAAEPHRLLFSVEHAQAVTGTPHVPVAEAQCPGERSRMLVEALGGIIQRQAAPAGGVFSFTLPGRES